MRSPRIAVAWKGLPPYAANAIAYTQKRYCIDFPVIGTEPAVPYSGIENILSKSPLIIELQSAPNWADLDLTRPDLLFVSGWRGAFESLIRDTHSHGGNVVAMSDQQWKWNYFQIRRWLSFTIKFRNRTKAIWVPGKAARDNARRLGFKDENIYEGLLTAMTRKFSPGPPLIARQKKFVFVGRYAPEKNILRMSEAYAEFRRKYPGWTLETFGAGPNHGSLVDRSGIKCFGFGDSDRIAKALRGARFLVLPSLNEAWGLVVHEACCSGCGLLLSNEVGAARDLANEANSILFTPKDVLGIESAFERAAALDDSQLRDCYHTSLRMSTKYSPSRWASTFMSIINRFHVCE